MKPKCHHAMSNVGKQFQKQNQLNSLMNIYIYICVCVCVCVCACVWGGGGGNEDPKSNLNGQSRLFLRMHLESRGRSLVM